VLKLRPLTLTAPRLSAIVAPRLAPRLAPRVAPGLAARVAASVAPRVARGVAPGLAARLAPRLSAILAAILIGVLATSCTSSTQPPAAPVETAPVAAEAPSPEPPPVGVVRVTASTLNVRRQPATTADVLQKVNQGDRLTLLSVGNDWMQVQLPNGSRGWVSSNFVTRDDAAPKRTARTPKRRDGCAPDSDYRFTKTPTPTFSDSGAHGLVVVEATVDKNGTVQSTRLVSNSTGDESLGFLAQKELKEARFEAPVRGCVARAFIFTYTRTF
jgi:TonB family protein